MSMKRTFRRPRATAFSIAMTIASGTRSTATSRTEGSASAVPAVKVPLPQPSSICTSRKGSVSQRPRMASGSVTRTAEAACMRGMRFFFLRILIGLFTLRVE